MNQLSGVIQTLGFWQEAQDRAKCSRNSRCLEAVRYALKWEGLRLPAPRQAPDNTALGNFEVLAKDPGAYGWEAIHSPLLSEICLVYFKDCGRLKDGRTAGHISIYNPKTGILYANKNYRWGPYWARRLVGAFVPE